MISTLFFKKEKEKKSPYFWQEPPPSFTQLCQAADVLSNVTSVNIVTIIVITSVDITVNITAIVVTVTARKSSKSESVSSFHNFTFLILLRTQQEISQLISDSQLLNPALVLAIIHNQVLQ